MQIVRYADRRKQQVTVGVLSDDGATITELSVAGSISNLLRLSVAELEALVAETVKSGDSVPSDQVLLLPPVDGATEVWASGVTYERSMAARVEESTEKSVYERVYDAERPELFFKSVAWRVVTDGEPIAIRDDSGLDVPEPELGLVINSRAEIVGYVVCNDMSSRSIEGENPLYLPQAKVYAGSCAISSGIRPVWEVADARSLDIELTVHRDGKPAWQGETSTARMKRPLDELVAYLFRGESFPEGAFLATGTGIIPEMSFTLAAGDRVDIEIASVGTLSNPVVAGKAALAWLADAVSDPFVRETVR
ncbi:fumarylacetoacetate hydrolase family protein [Flindersiella endophytica]